NNEPVLNIDLDDWTEAQKNPDGTKNKFNVAYKDLPRKGYIGLQDHGFKVWYRNIRIKEL
ncbi:MAG: family 16 glycoside hydrolase, partial [Planctomycetota bacterium]